MHIRSKILAFLPLLGLQAAGTGAATGSPVAQLQYFVPLRCTPSPGQKLTLTTDGSCYNLPLPAITPANSYKGYLVSPLPAGVKSCSVNLFAYPDCVEVTSDSGPLKQDSGLCIDIFNIPPGAQSARLVCES
ncbi:hypothetical protein MMC07_006089 [Pseudocyphellaria aurata]|nr:hypothetical protein [Pseudocyphellaria aurata]